MSDGPGAATEYLERPPGPDLAPFVTKLWYLRTPSVRRYERIVPLPFVHLIVGLSGPYTVLRRGETPVGDVFPRAFVSGLQTSYLINENPTHIHHVGAEFRPWAIGAVTDVPAAGLADAVTDGGVVFPGIGELREVLRAATPSDAIGRLEAELLGRLRHGWQPHPSVVTAVDLIATDPDLPIAAIADRCGVSHKTLIAQFRRHTGLTPKTYADIYRHYRFLGELPREGPMPTWTELVSRVGYYDQPHFIRVFTRFTGMTPRRYLDAIGKPGLEHPSFVAMDDEG